MPDARWVSGLGADRVFARADRGQGDADRPDKGKGARAKTGVALYVTSRYAMFKYAITNKDDSALVEVPPAGWRREAVNRYFAAYVRC